MPVNPPPTPAQLPSPSPLPAVALLLLLLCWALLCLVHLRRVGELYDPKRAAAAIRTQYEQLGPPSYPEVAPPVGSGLSLAAQLEGRPPMQRPQGTEPPGAGLLHALLYARDLLYALGERRGRAVPTSITGLRCPPSAHANAWTAHPHPALPSGGTRSCAPTPRWRWVSTS